MYAWQHEDTFEGWQTTTATRLSQNRPDGQSHFYLQAVNGIGEVSEILELGPWLIDSIPPTVTLATQSSIITNPHTTHISFSWLGDDDGQSPLTFDMAYATATLGSEPPPAPLDADLSGLTVTTLGLSELGLNLKANTTYYIWLRGHDEAGNISQWLEQSISYSPAPLLQLNPKQLYITRLYSETTPITLPLTISNGGGGMLIWQALTPFSYTQLSSYAGVATSTLLLTITHPTTVGNYHYPITFTGPLTSYNSPYLLPIRVRVMVAIYPIYLPFVFKK